MFGIKRLFGYDKAKLKEPVPTLVEELLLVAPGTEISYDLELIPQLKQEHEELLYDLIDIIHYTKDLQLSRSHSLFINFQELVSSHSLVEYSQIYPYLENTFKYDPVNNGIVHKFQRDINNLSKSVKEFSKRWINSQLTKENAADFIGDCQEIAHVLLENIKEQEERVYELYEMSPTLLIRANDFEH